MTDRQMIMDKVEAMGQAERGRTLRAARECIGWSQEDVAQRFGVAKQTVKRWEKASQFTPDEVLVEVLALYESMCAAAAGAFKSGVPPVVYVHYPRTFENWLEDSGVTGEEASARNWQQALALSRAVATYASANGADVRFM